MSLPTLCHRLLMRPVSIAPLITFRILFGGLMAFGALRFMLSGWIERLYGEPKFFFKYYGFEWVSTFDPTGMYVVYGIISLSAFMVMIGLFYRAAIIIFFLSFTYAELTDLTNYLNHYYLVCLLAFLMIFLPAGRCLSVDARRHPERRVDQVPVWTVNMLILQLSIVYFFAGFAKLNSDWLLRAMPLAVWLPTKSHWPLLGPLFEQSWVAFAFSWAGAFYDLTIPLWLLNRRTRPFAYAAVIVFHGLTKLLFNIGLFPFIMIFNTLIFFPASFHEKLLALITKTVWQSDQPRLWRPTSPPACRQDRVFRFLGSSVLLFFCSLQLLLPLRFLAYRGNVLWTEQGYRFAWRVMLVEKTGHATFFVEDPLSGRRSEVDNRQHLTPFQEKQMAIQPDLMLQYARFLSTTYRDRYGIEDPVVTVDSYVALNGRPSQRFIDPSTNLAAIEDNWKNKDWILPLGFTDNELTTR